MATMLQLVLLALLVVSGTAPRIPPLAADVPVQQAFLADNAPPIPERVGFVRNPEHVAPVLTAQAAVAVDVETGAVLYRDHPSRRLAIASLNKLMVALVVRDELADLDVPVTVPEDAHSIEGTRSWITTGATYSARDLLRATLIGSAADATLALSTHIGGGSRDAFVAKMNALARERGFTSLSFTNPVGMDAPDNYGSAHDVAALLRAVWDDPVLRAALESDSITITPVGGGRPSTITTTNDLLDAKGYTILGGKTGTTDEAGQAFAVIGSVDGGRPMISVVLGSSNRFADTKALLAWCAVAWDTPTP